MKIQAANLTVIVKTLQPKKDKEETFTTQAKSYEQGEIVSVSPMIEDDILNPLAPEKSTIGKTLIYIKHEDNKQLDTDHTAVHYDNVIGVE